MYQNSFNVRNSIEKNTNLHDLIKEIFSVLSDHTRVINQLASDRHHCRFCNQYTKLENQINEIRGEISNLKESQLILSKKMVAIQTELEKVEVRNEQVSNRMIETKTMIQKEMDRLNGRSAYIDHSVQDIFQRLGAELENLRKTSTTHTQRITELESQTAQARNEAKSATSTAEECRRQVRLGADVLEDIQGAVGRLGRALERKVEESALRDVAMELRRRIDYVASRLEECEERGLARVHEALAAVEGRVRHMGQALEQVDQDILAIERTKASREEVNEALRKLVCRDELKQLLADLGGADVWRGPSECVEALGPMPLSGGDPICQGHYGGDPIPHGSAGPGLGGLGCYGAMPLAGGVGGPMMGFTG